MSCTLSLVLHCPIKSVFLLPIFVFGACFRTLGDVLFQIFVAVVVVFFRRHSVCVVLSSVDRMWILYSAHFGECMCQLASKRWHNDKKKHSACVLSRICVWRDVDLCAMYLHVMWLDFHWSCVCVCDASVKCDSSFSFVPLNIDIYHDIVSYFVMYASVCTITWPHGLSWISVYRSLNVISFHVPLIHVSAHVRPCTRM